MSSETVVAVFDTPAHAETAILDLVANGIPAAAIEQYSRDTGFTPGDAIAETAPQSQVMHPHRGFWAWLTGEDEPSHHHQHLLFDQTMRTGNIVVTVISDGTNIDLIYHLLDLHDPVELDDRQPKPLLHASSPTQREQGLSPGLQGVGAIEPGLAAAGASETVVPFTPSGRPTARSSGRIRRFFAPHPVDEQIRRRNEAVSIYRHPLTSSRFGEGAFSAEEILSAQDDLAAQASPTRASTPAAKDPAAL